MVNSVTRNPIGMMSRRSMVASAVELALALRAGNGVFARQASGEDGRERLRDVLSLVPQSLILAGHGTPWFSWVDLRAHFTASGLDDPLTALPPIDIVRVLEVPADVIGAAGNPDVSVALGFDISDVHQIVTVGGFPEMVWIFRGGPDFRALAETWEAGGYRPASREWGDFWTRGEEGEIAMDDPVWRAAMGNLGNIAILDDSTIVLSRTADMVGEIVQAAGGGGTKVADSVTIAPLIDAMPPDVASVMAYAGDILSLGGLTPMPIGADSIEEAEEMLTTFEEQLQASEAAAGAMPRILSAMNGVVAGVTFPEEGASATPTAGQAPGGRIALLTGSDDAAEDAAGVMFWRYENMESLNTGEPYREMFTVLNTGDTATQGDVAYMDLAPDDAARGIVTRLILDRDYLPFAW